MINHYFDAYTEIGPRRGKHPSALWNLDHLLQEMERCLISRALVSHTQSVWYDPMLGNRRLVEMLKGHPNLSAIWNLLPQGSGEMPDVMDLEEELIKTPIGAFTVYPKTNNWSIRSRRGDELLNWLSKRSEPLILSWNELEGYEDLRLLHDAYPTLKLIIRGCSWTDQRQLIAALEEFERFSFTLERYQTHYGIEELIERGWGHRICFASNSPSMSMGAHRFYIDYAMIPEAARQAVASGNLCNLIGEEDSMGIAQTPRKDIYINAALEGKPLPGKVLDFHLHVLDQGLNGAGWLCRMRDGDMNGMTKLLSHCGVCGGGIMSWNGPVSCDIAAGNLCVQSSLDSAAPSYWGLATFDPTHYSQDEMAKMIQQVYDSDHRLVGMKPYRWFGIPYHDPLYDVWWNYGNEHHLYALIHRTLDDFTEVNNLAKRFPNVRWVVAHCGENFKVADMAVECAQRHDNVYLEITMTSVTAGIIEYLVEGAGDGRVLYGSDAPMRDPRQQLGWVVYADISESSKTKILGDNARKVLSPIWEDARRTFKLDGV